MFGFVLVQQIQQAKDSGRRSFSCTDGDPFWQETDHD